jgi:hypothetical protein
MSHAGSRLFLLASIAFLSSPLIVEAAPVGRSWNPDADVRVLVDGSPLREYVHKGRRYVMGREGHRYAIRVTNRTAARIEVVVTVDGLDVVDGRAGDYATKRGYVLDPWQSHDIEGFRLDLGRVATFRFAPVHRSYAAQTGDDRNVGVIGVAVFRESRPVRIPRPRPHVAGGYLDGSEEAEPSAERFARDRETSSKSMDSSKAGASGRGGLHAPQYRPGLGTGFGEARDSRVGRTTFRRANPNRPDGVAILHYDDRAGLIAAGVPLHRPGPREVRRRQQADPFPGLAERHGFAVPPHGWED